MKNDDLNENKKLDQYTESVLEQGVSRRNFLRHSALGAAGAGLLGLPTFASVAAKPAQAKENTMGKSSDGAATLSFLPHPKTIADSEINTTLTFDVVVVGAGASGVPAALLLLENGATVAVIQKAPFALSQGNTGSGIDLAGSDKAGIEALVSRVCEDNAHRCHPDLIRQWAYNSGEAVRWVIHRAKRGGSPVIDQGNVQHGDLLNVNGYKLNWVTSFFGPKPYTTGDGMRHLAITAEKAGVKFFYNMPAEQLVQSKGGEVLGVVAKSRDGKYTKFLAKKGVILATGDYQNNKAMCDYFVPDVKNFGRKQMGKTGDGFVMAYWAGGVIEPIGHTKMLHDFDGGPAPMCDMPFLAVNREGKRFVNETVAMSVLNNYLRDARNAGHYAQIFDSNYMTQAATGPASWFHPRA